MAQTITPVVHGGRRTRWAITLVLHVAGATVAAAAFGALLGAAGSLLGAPWGRAGGIVVATVAVAYAAREVARIPVPVPELRRQVPEWWRTSFSSGVAAFLYGVGLGIGFLTYLRHGTLVAVAVAVAALGDPWLGVAAVAPFGLARSLAVAAVWHGTTEHRLGQVLETIERLGAGVLRRAANAVALGALAVVAAGLTASSGDGFPPMLPTTVLAVTFGWAALAKASGGWEAALDGYALPSPVRRAVAMGVPVAEAAVAGLLLAGAVTAGGGLALLLLAAFSAAIVRAGRSRGGRLPCGCFGGSRTRSTRWLLGRNAALGAVSVAVIAAGERVPMPRPPGPGETLPAVLVVGGGVLAAVLLARASALWRRRPQPTG